MIVRSRTTPRSGPVALDDDEELQAVIDTARADNAANFIKLVIKLSPKITSPKSMGLYLFLQGLFLHPKMSTIKLDSLRKLKATACAKRS